MGGGCLLFGGETWARSRRRRVRRSFWLPVLIRLCSSVIHGHLNATTTSARRGAAAATDVLTLTSGGRARTPAEVRPAPSEAPPLSRGSTAPAKREWDRRARAACSCAGSQVWGSFAPAASSSRSRTAYLWPRPRYQFSGVYDDVKRLLKAECSCEARMNSLSRKQFKRLGKHPMTRRDSSKSY